MSNPSPALLTVATAAMLAGSANAALVAGITLKDFDGTAPNPNMGPLKAINGAGLPGAIPDLSAAHTKTWSDHWYSSLKAGAYITVDLMDNYALDTIHVWNENEGGSGGGRGMKNVTIYVSPDDNVANLVALTTGGAGVYDDGSGGFLFPQGPGDAAYTGFDLDLSGVTNAPLLGSVRLIKIENSTNYGTTNGSGLAEVQFGGTAIPEPASVSLVMLAGLGGVLVRRRRA